MRKPKQIVWEASEKKYIPDKNSIGQIKYDGSQYHLHTFNGKAFALTSRRVSVKTGLLNEKIANFPGLKGSKVIRSEGYTVIVCEAVAEHLRTEFLSGKIKLVSGKKATWNKRSNYVASIMNSSVKNLKSHKLKLIAHTVMIYNGKNVEHLSYLRKWKFLKQRICNPAGQYGQFLYDSKKIVFHITPLKMDISNPKKALKLLIKKLDIEGIFIKDVNSDLCKKVKRERDADCIIIDYKKGNGKYKGMVGSIIVGVLKNDSGQPLTNCNELNAREVKLLLKNNLIKQVGKISGFTDSVRIKVTKNKTKYLGKVVQCEYMQWTGKKMRHPRIGEKGIRDDKLVKRCTINQFIN